MSSTRVQGSYQLPGDVAEGDKFPPQEEAVLQQVPPRSLTHFPCEAGSSRLKVVRAAPCEATLALSTVTPGAYDYKLSVPVILINTLPNEHLVILGCTAESSTPEEQTLHSSDFPVTVLSPMQVQHCVIGLHWIAQSPFMPRQFDCTLSFKNDKDHVCGLRVVHERDSYGLPTLETLFPNAAVRSSIIAFASCDDMSFASMGRDWAALRRQGKKLIVEAGTSPCNGRGKEAKRVSETVSIASVEEWVRQAQTAQSSTYVVNPFSSYSSSSVSRHVKLHLLIDHPASMPYAFGLESKSSTGRSIVYAFMPDLTKASPTNPGVALTLSSTHVRPYGNVTVTWDSTDIWDGKPRSHWISLAIPNSGPSEYVMYWYIESATGSRDLTLEKEGIFEVRYFDDDSSEAATKSAKIAVVG
jgi:hypothetical protein